jgi:pyroglutamyl-peptidase
MNNVLLTGFGPFREHAVNPSQLVAERLNGEVISGFLVTGTDLEVEFGRDIEVVLPLIDKLKPVLVLSLGLNAGIESIDLEMFAINHHRGDADSDHLPIIGDAPAAYFATIDLNRIAKSAGERSPIPVRKHGYAGSYLCNHIFYQTLHYTSTDHINTRVGFMHIPCASEHMPGNSALTSASYPLDSLVEAVRIVLEEALTSYQPELSGV